MRGVCRRLDRPPCAVALGYQSTRPSLFAAVILAVRAPAGQHATALWWVQKRVKSRSDLTEDERKDIKVARRDRLREIEKTMQAKWDAEKTFYVDAPKAAPAAQGERKLTADEIIAECKAQGVEPDRQTVMFTLGYAAGMEAREKAEGKSDEGESKAEAEDGKFFCTFPYVVGPAGGSDGGVGSTRARGGSSSTPESPHPRATRPRSVSARPRRSAATREPGIRT